METRRLGKSDLEITPIGCGSWAIGGGEWEFGWGKQDDEESVRAIQAALEAGINWIDTAPAYGLGRSEEVVGKTVKDWSGKKPYIFTKCSMVWGEDRKIGHSLKAESLRKEVEASLRRLQVEAIDLYQIHWPNPDEEIEEGWHALAKMQQEGKLRYLGVSNFNVAQIKRAQAIAPVTSIQPPYSMIKRDAEAQILPYARQQDIGVLAYSPMQSGLLTGKMTRERVEKLPDNDWRKDGDAFKEPNLTRNLEVARRIGEIGARHKISAAEVAIAWVLNNPAITGAIVGVRRPDQVKGIQGAFDFRLNAEELREIEAFLPHKVNR